jgi:hypothetical protein
VPAVVHPGGGRLQAGAGYLAEPPPRTLVQRAVAHDHLGDPGGDRHRRLLHDRAGGASPVAHLAEEPQLAKAELAGQGDLGGAVHGERHQPVDVGGRQPGVGQRGGRRLGGQPQLAAARVLRELGGADAGYRGRPGDHGAFPMWTVPVT